MLALNEKCGGIRPIAVALTLRRLASTVWPKKLAPFLYALTLPNIGRFSKLFHCQNQVKICNNAINKKFHHTSRVSQHYLAKCQVA